MFGKKIRFKDLELSESIDGMIQEITTGDLGTLISKETWELWTQDSVDAEYSYSGNRLYLYYSTKDRVQGTIKSYSVRYNGEEVYNCENGRVLVFNRNREWVDKVNAVYQQHLNRIKENKARYQYKKERDNKEESIKQIFSLLRDKRSGYNGYYEDDKIIIDKITFQNDAAPDYSTSMDCTTYYGRIRLKDGTVVMDSYNGICHPGNWENYVLSLINRLQARINYTVQSERQARENKEKIKKLEYERRYEMNHSPIDDSRYFR